MHHLELFLCDNRKWKDLLACIACQRPHEQPSWVYGNGTAAEDEVKAPTAEERISALESALRNLHEAKENAGRNGGDEGEDG